MLPRPPSWLMRLGLTEYKEQVTRRYSAGTAQQVHEVLITASNTYLQEAYYK